MSEMTRLVVARERPSKLVLLGHPVSHSRSPMFQNAALAHAGIPITYDRLDVAPPMLVDALELLAEQGAGGNVTIPHKEAVATRAVCSELASRVGAVNTFWHERRVLHGHNTDVAGALATIATFFPNGLAGVTCAVLGAGGSAAAILVALELAGSTQIRVAARTGVRAHALAARVGVNVRVAESPEEAVRNADFVVNATPIGLHDEMLPVALDALAPHAAVFDLVYRVGETAWVRACRATGHHASDGQRMLMEQGAAAFECWFDIEAPRDVMWRALQTADS